MANTAKNSILNRPRNTPVISAAKPIFYTVRVQLGTDIYTAYNGVLKSRANRTFEDMRRTVMVSKGSATVTLSEGLNAANRVHILAGV